MALLMQTIQLGDLKGAIHLYEHVGDELPVHVHDETTNHISLVSNGSFLCTGNPAIEGKILTKGMVVDWPVGEPHGFTAREANSKMIQINKKHQANT